MTETPGEIRCMYELTCGICHETSTFRQRKPSNLARQPTMRWARGLARLLGYRWRKRFGLVCPNCVAQMEGNAAAIRATETSK